MNLATLNILGCLIKNPELLANEKYHFTADMFEERHQRIIFGTVNNLYRVGVREIDPFIIDAHLANSPVQREILLKNKEYLYTAIEVAALENFDYNYKKFEKLNYLKMVEEMGIDTSDIYNPNPDITNSSDSEAAFDLLTIDDIHSRLVLRLDVVKEQFDRHFEESEYHIGDGIDDLLELLKIESVRGINISGDLLSHTLHGAQKQTLMLVSAPSGVGKTRFLLSTACRFAFPEYYCNETQAWIKTGYNRKTLFYATEQIKFQIQLMVLSYLSGVPEDKIADNLCDFEEYSRVVKAQEIMKTNRNLIIDRASNPTLSSVSTRIKNHIINNGVEYVIYDYIQISPGLIAEFGGRVRDDVVLGMFSGRLKEIAEEFDVFVLSATQVNGDREARKDKDERMVRGARSIIDKCDTAMILSRITEEEEMMLAELIPNTGSSDQKYMPNVVFDIYKNRSSKFSPVRIFSLFDHGKIRIKDVLVTDKQMRPIQLGTIIKVEDQDEELQSTV